NWPTPLLTPSTHIGGVSTGRFAVFTFTDVRPASPSSGTIFWGDGSSSLASATDGSITRNADGSFTAWGSHTYAEEARGLTFTVAGNDVGRPDHHSYSALIDVADAPLTATGTAVSAPDGAAFSNVQVGTLTDTAGTYSNPNDLSATITWGDSTPTRTA